MSFLPMSTKTFKSLVKEDFENSAVLEEIRTALEDRDRLLEAARELLEFPSSATAPKNLRLVIRAVKEQH